MVALGRIPGNERSGQLLARPAQSAASGGTHCPARGQIAPGTLWL
jgi:hypothetical protein